MTLQSFINAIKAVDAPAFIASSLVIMEYKEILGVIGLTLSTAYLIRKWHREEIEFKHRKKNQDQDEQGDSKTT